MPLWLSNEAVLRSVRRLLRVGADGVFHGVPAVDLAVCFKDQLDGFLEVFPCFVESCTLRISAGQFRNVGGSPLTVVLEYSRIIHLPKFLHPDETNRGHCSAVGALPMNWRATVAKPAYAGFSAFGEGRIRPV